MLQSIFGYFKKVPEMIGGMLSQFTPTLKCNSNCCTNIKVYDPGSCCFNGDVSNRWNPLKRVSSTSRATAEPTKSTEEFFTPRGT